MRDTYSDYSAVQAIAPAVLAATATGSGIDLAGFNSALVVINTGAIAGDGDYTAKLQDSADNTNFTDVDAGDVLGSFPASLAANSVVRVGYVGSNRYVRLVVTKNSGTSIAAGAVVVKGHAAIAPV